jgi:predicted nucleic acid-binding Zn ribbon protein
LRDCPGCGEPALRKMVTAAGFQLKGSGWYVTDFKGGTKPKQDKSSEEAKAPKPEAAKPAAASGSSSGS